MSLLRLIWLLSVPPVTNKDDTTHLLVDILRHDTGLLPSTVSIILKTDQFLVNVPSDNREAALGFLFDHTVGGKHLNGHLVLKTCF
jgi:hypothetical protein